nr:hypothetical protein Iba_chr14aCG6250 [Ipomoea batatas]
MELIDFGSELLRSLLVDTGSTTVNNAAIAGGSYSQATTAGQLHLHRRPRERLEIRPLPNDFSFQSGHQLKHPSSPQSFHTYKSSSIFTAQNGRLYLSSAAATSSVWILYPTASTASAARILSSPAAASAVVSSTPGNATSISSATTRILSTTSTTRNAASVSFPARILSSATGCRAPPPTTAVSSIPLTTAILLPGGRHTSTSDIISAQGVYHRENSWADSGRSGTWNSG